MPITKATGATVRFRDLAVGQHFRFPPGGSWDRQAKKVSSKCYVAGDSRAHHPVAGKGRQAHFVGRPRAGLLKFCVGTINVKVIPTGRRSPVKRRKGRNRGPATLGSLKKMSGVPILLGVVGGLFLLTASATKAPATP